jgi:hypothetical protein
MARESESTTALPTTSIQTEKFLSPELIAGEASDLEDAIFEGEIANLA